MFSGRGVALTVVALDKIVVIVIITTIIIIIIIIIIIVFFFFFFFFFTDYPATKLLLKPITGRRHQLRVHLSESGHTIVGDFTYSNRRDLLPFRMFLHAYRLIIPTEYEHIDIRTEDPFVDSDPRNKWTVVETLNTLTEETFTKLKLGRKWYK